MATNIEHTFRAFVICDEEKKKYYLLVNVIHEQAADRQLPYRNIIYMKVVYRPIYLCITFTSKYYFLFLLKMTNARKVG
jgi:hypothetical protein